MYIYQIMLRNNMKLKKHLNRKDKSTGKEFYRYDLTIDPNLVSELKWKVNQELKAKVSGKRLVIEKE